MIVISHDDELVDQLIRGCQPEYTYHLAKNNAGHTIVKKIFSNDAGLGFFRNYMKIRIFKKIFMPIILPR